MKMRAVRGGRGFAALLGVFLAGWLGCASADEAPTSRATLDPAEALRISQAAIGRKIGDYTLLDRAGKPVRLADYRGKPLLVNFMYTGCFQVCPTRQNLSRDVWQLSQMGFSSARSDCY